jgi:tRNA pseudouridine38-40 synthase
MPTYKLTIAYDGTLYSGWQVQKNALSIQSLIQNALCTVLRTPVSLTGAGRTDAGVHALGQTAHIATDAPVVPRRLQLSLNALLPADIRILAIEPVPDGFHARYSAIGKVYHYHLRYHLAPNPFTRLYAASVLHPVDLELLTRAAPLFLGTRDFTAFAHEAHTGSASRNPIRTLYRLDVVEEPGGCRLEFEGNGFLYKMVRTITGTLLDVSRGKIALSDIPALFAARDRRRAGKTAPACGLFLVRVLYRDSRQGGKVENATEILSSQLGVRRRTDENGLMDAALLQGAESAHRIFETNTPVVGLS